MVKFALRMDNGIYEKLGDLAYIDRRSINSQIVYILEEYIKQYEKENGQINFHEKKE